ncbi:Adenylosuccinate synthetase [Poriferisphaera corsica]|uniref:Adenylosuccinate synthetase n=2 Tax=Poriferisphaera corsica TaxID=2528020 RepID=A0A517YX23_9BACT|nr:adenylosuccinate synthase [Poriferisphaera corsica]QDU34783.1 Adenylosuccinate synthetase [Poriferisphaera corsica]
MTSEVASAMSNQTTVPSAEQLLQSMGLTNGHSAIVGLQWGDEGKGKVVDLLTVGFDTVVRYNGGANAGHTVCVGDEKYKLHLLPSGMLYSGKTNVLGNGVVIDPEQLVKEVHGLRERGKQVDAENLKISDRAHVVLPWHKIEDNLLEVTSKAPIGTTGRGIGPCYADKAIRLNAIRMGDLTDDAKLVAKVNRIAEFKNTLLSALASAHKVDFTPVNAEEIIATLRKCMEVLGPMVTDTSSLIHEKLRTGDRFLFEGANANLLDIDHGTYPYVTSSNCSSLGVHTGAAFPGRNLNNVIGIVKAYQTRVGEGPMPTELHDEIGERIREVGREYGTTTGRPRRCGWLDLVALKYTASVSGATHIALMLLDVLAGLTELKICTAYEVDGKKTTNFPADNDVLAKAKPVLESLPGFEESVEDCRTFDELPENAKAYIARIEAEIGVPVVFASVGPRRDQSVLR